LPKKQEKAKTALLGGFMRPARDIFCKRPTHLWIS